MSAVTGLLGVIQVLNMDTCGQFGCLLLLEASILYLTYRRPMILQKLWCVVRQMS